MRVTKVTRKCHKLMEWPQSTFRRIMSTADAKQRSFQRRNGRRHTGGNFINILFVTFSYKSALRSFSLMKVWLCNFWH